MKQRYDPRRHHRRSIRLKGWDYSSPAAYFVTICTHQRQNLFEDEQIHQVVEKAWQAIPTHPHGQHVTLDEWIVMPNHLHGIIVITVTNRRGAASGSRSSRINEIPVSDASHQSSAPAGSLSVIIGNFKSVVTRRINQLRDAPGAKVWQRGYYARIVRNDRELNAIRKYVKDNLCRWSEDSENLDMIIARMDMMR